MSLFHPFHHCISEEQLPTEEEGSRHAGMRHTEADTAFAMVNEVLLIERIDDIERQQQFLIMPGQRDDMRDGKVIDRVGRTMGRVGLSTFLRRPQP